MKFKEWKCGRYTPTLDAICDSLKRWHSEKNGRFIRKEVGEAEFRKRVKESLSFSNYVDGEGRRHDTRIFVFTGKPIAQETEDAINALLGGRRISDDVLAKLPEVAWARKEKRRIEREYAKRTGMTDTSEIDTPERKELREDILTELQPDSVCRYHGQEWLVKRNNRLDIVLGLPASGKSTLVVADLAKENGSRVCDADDVKERLPEYAGGLGCDLVRMESNRINGNALMAAARLGENVVYPVVGADAVTVAEVVKLARQVGYKVHLTFAKADPGIAKGRAISRLVGKGRFTEPAFFDKAAKESERTFKRLARYADSATVKVTYMRGE